MDNYSGTFPEGVDYFNMGNYKVPTPSLKYCRKGQTFIDGNGKKTAGDDCFSKILIKCTE